VAETSRVAILDTDIGTDVDDILALVLLANAPEVNLIGVTTVYGDTALRARMVNRVLDRMGHADVRIGIGAQETLTHRPVFWAGHEGEGIADLDGVGIDSSVSASALLHHAAAAHRGALDLFAIGPLTNVAAAILADDAFAASLHHLYLMGGAFWMEHAEHNIKSDPEAAEIVFRSGIPTTVCGLDVTQRVMLRETDLPHIGAAADGVGPMLEYQIRRWWAFTRANENPLHDPLAVLAAFRPDLFRFTQGDVRIDLESEKPGRTTVTPRADGPHRTAAAVDEKAAAADIVRRIAGE
jgi:purine nucleosidase